MADHIVDGNAAALGEAFIMQAGGITAVGFNIILNGFINRCRIHAGLNQRSCHIQRAVINHACCLDSGDIFLIVDDFLRRAHLSLKHIKLDFLDAFIKIRMAFLVLFAAATPAKFVSLHKMHNLL